MRFNISLHNDKTGESKSFVATLNAAECEIVEGLRSHGDESADLIAQSMALRHAYAEINPREFDHIAPPELILVS